ncbi:hypothetical protein K8R47_02675 [archaeon]|nr:hypothetical protein [archaeon]
MRNLERTISEIESDDERYEKFMERAEALTTLKIFIPTYVFNNIKKLSNKGNFDKNVRPLMYGLAVFHETLLASGYVVMANMVYQNLG